MSDKAAAEACDTVADFPVFDHVWADFFDCSGIVAACQGTFGGFAVEVLVVGRIEGNGRCFDEDIARFDVARDGKGRRDFNNAFGPGYNCLLGTLRWTSHGVENAMKMERKERENVRFLNLRIQVV